VALNAITLTPNFLNGQLSYEVIFPLSQGWSLNTSFTKYLCLVIISFFYLKTPFLIILIFVSGEWFIQQLYYLWTLLYTYLNF
jgi:hypothetical protein